MKDHHKSYCIKTLVIVGVSTTTWAYVVKDGDTLSEIAYKNISSKVYGKDGSIKKILALNPQIKNSDLLRPGQMIHLNESRPLNLTEFSNDRSIATQRETELKAKAIVELTPFYFMTNLSATDNASGSESVVASKYYVGVNACHVQEWSKDFQTAIHLKLASIGFEEPASSTKTLQDKTKFLSSLGFETNHHLADNTRLKLGLSYGKELFIRASSTQSVAVDAVNIPSVSSKISYDIKKLSPFTLGVSASYALKMPTSADSYNVKLGHEYGASVYLNQQTAKSSFQTELGFTQRKQNTSVTSQTETNIMLGVRFPFEIGSAP